MESPECDRRNVLLTKCHVDRAYDSYAFWGGDDEALVDDVLVWFRQLNETFERISPCVEALYYPTVTDITFGQFVDSKMITADSTRNVWELAQYIMAIYGKGKYEAHFVREDSDVFLSVANEPLNIAVSVLKWFDDLNNHINTNYTVFQDSGEDEKPNMKEHMQRWGWINFLKSIAKTKVFDIAGSGMNSIDCARAASLDDVLVWASEEKDFNLATMRDMEIKN